MSDETEMASTSTEAATLSPTQVVNDTLEYFLSTASVEAVYNEPIKHGNTLLIPAAEVVSIMGFGVGGGEASREWRRFGVVGEVEAVSTLAR